MSMKVCNYSNFAEISVSNLYDKLFCKITEFIYLFFILFLLWIVYLNKTSNYTLQNTINRINKCYFWNTTSNEWSSTGLALQGYAN